MSVPRMTDESRLSTNDAVVYEAHTRTASEGNPQEHMHKRKSESFSNAAEIVTGTIRKHSKRNVTDKPVADNGSSVHLPPPPQPGANGDGTKHAGLKGTGKTFTRSLSMLKQRKQSEKMAMSISAEAVNSVPIDEPHNNSIVRQSSFQGKPTSATAAKNGSSISEHERSHKSASTVGDTSPSPGVTTKRVTRSESSNEKSAKNHFREKSLFKEKSQEITARLRRSLVPSRYRSTSLTTTAKREKLNELCRKFNGKQLGGVTARFDPASSGRYLLSFCICKQVIVTVDIERTEFKSKHTMTKHTTAPDLKTKRTEGSSDLQVLKRGRERSLLDIRTSIDDKTGSSTGVRYTNVEMIFFNDALLLVQYTSRECLPICPPLFLNSLVVTESPDTVHHSHRKLDLIHGDSRLTVKTNSEVMRDAWVKQIQGALEWALECDSYTVTLGGAEDNVCTRVTDTPFPETRTSLTDANAMFHLGVPMDAPDGYTGAYDNGLFHPPHTLSDNELKSTSSGSLPHSRRQSQISMSTGSKSSLTRPRANTSGSARSSGASVRDTIDALKKPSLNVRIAASTISVEPMLPSLPTTSSDPDIAKGRRAKNFTSSDDFKHEGGSTGSHLMTASPREMLSTPHAEDSASESKKSVSNSIQAFTAHTDGTMSGGIQCMNVNGEDIMMYSNYTEDDKPRMHVLAGTIEKLVERLADELPFDSEYVSVFLTTYQCMIDGPTLIRKLIGRFNSKPRSTSKEDLAFYSKWKKPIQTKVLRVILMWIWAHWTDFGTNEVLKKILVDFVPVVEEGGFVISSFMMNEAIANREKRHSERQVIIKDLESLANSAGAPIDSWFGLYSENDIADQMTLLDSTIYSTVPVRHFLYHIWPLKHNQPKKSATKPPRSSTKPQETQNSTNEVTAISTKNVTELSDPVHAEQRASLSPIHMSPTTDHTAVITKITRHPTSPTPLMPTQYTPLQHTLAETTPHDDTTTHDTITHKDAARGRTTREAAQAAGKLSSGKLMSPPRQTRKNSSPKPRILKTKPSDSEEAATVDRSKTLEECMLKNVSDDAMRDDAEAGDKNPETTDLQTSNTNTNAGPRDYGDLDVQGVDVRPIDQWTCTQAHTQPAIQPTEGHGNITTRNTKNPPINKQSRGHGASVSYPSGATDSHTHRGFARQHSHSNPLPATPTAQQSNCTALHATGLQMLNNNQSMATVGERSDSSTTSDTTLSRNSLAMAHSATEKELCDSRTADNLCRSIDRCTNDIRCSSGPDGGKSIHTTPSAPVYKNRQLSTSPTTAHDTNRQDTSTMDSPTHIAPRVTAFPRRLRSRTNPSSYRPPLHISPTSDSRACPANVFGGVHSPKAHPDIHAYSPISVGSSRLCITPRSDEHLHNNVSHTQLSTRADLREHASSNPPSPVPGNSAAPRLVTSATLTRSNTVHDTLKSSDSPESNVYEQSPGFAAIAHGVPAEAPPKKLPIESDRNTVETLLSRRQSGAYWPTKREQSRTPSPHKVNRDNSLTLPIEPLTLRTGHPISHTPPHRERDTSASMSVQISPMVSCDVVRDVHAMFPPVRRAMSIGTAMGHGRNSSRESIGVSCEPSTNIGLPSLAGQVHARGALSARPVDPNRFFIRTNSLPDAQIITAPIIAQSRSAEPSMADLLQRWSGRPPNDSSRDTVDSVIRSHAQSIRADAMTFDATENHSGNDEPLPRRSSMEKVLTIRRLQTVESASPMVSRSLRSVGSSSSVDCSLTCVPEMVPNPHTAPSKMSESVIFKKDVPHLADPRQAHRRSHSTTSIDSSQAGLLDAAHPSSTVYGRSALSATDSLRTAQHGHAHSHTDVRPESLAMAVNSICASDRSSSIAQNVDSPRKITSRRIRNALLSPRIFNRANSTDETHLDVSGKGLLSATVSDKTMKSQPRNSETITLGNLFRPRSRTSSLDHKRAHALAASMISDYEPMAMKNDKAPSKNAKSWRRTMGRNRSDTGTGKYQTNSSSKTDLRTDVSSTSYENSSTHRRDLRSTSDTFISISRDDISSTNLYDDTADRIDDRGKLHSKSGIVTAYSGNLSSDFKESNTKNVDGGGRSSSVKFDTRFITDDDCGNIEDGSSRNYRNNSYSNLASSDSFGQNNQGESIIYESNAKPLGKKSLSGPTPQNQMAAPQATSKVAMFRQKSDIRSVGGALSKSRSMLARDGRGQSKDKEKDKDKDKLDLFAKRSRALTAGSHLGLGLNEKVTSVLKKLMYNEEIGLDLFQDRDPLTDRLEVGMGNRYADAPQLNEFIYRFNYESYWVATEICTLGDDSRTQARYIAKFLAIAKRCIELRNYYGAFAIMGGLRFPPVRSLREAWKLVPPSVISDIKNFEATYMNPRSNMKIYRNAVPSPGDLPALPFVPLSLKDLVFINDGNEKMIPNTKMYNFDRLRRIAEICTSLNAYKRPTYRIARNKMIIGQLLNAKMTTNLDYLRILNTKNPPPERIARAVKADRDQRLASRSERNNPRSRLNNAGNS